MRWASLTVGSIPAGGRWSTPFTTLSSNFLPISLPARQRGTDGGGRHQAQRRRVGGSMTLTDLLLDERLERGSLLVDDAVRRVAIIFGRVPRRGVCELAAPLKDAVQRQLEAVSACLVAAIGDYQLEFTTDFP